MNINTEDYRNYCEIDLDAAAHNLKAARKPMAKDVKVLGVVKADAYGHGAVKISETLIENGVDYLGVACIEEALEQRKEFDIPILIFGYVPYNQIETAIRNNITLTVYNFECAKSISQCAGKLGKKALVHIKIDTGMNRIGFLPEAEDKVLGLGDLPGLDIEGIYTHFSCADCDDDYTMEQFEKFVSVCNYVGNKMGIRIKHCCNSAAALKFPEMHMDMVRLGLVLYGLNPGVDIDELVIKPVLQFKSKLVQVKKVPIGTKIGYGATFTTARESIIGTVSVGYADGYPRGLSNNAAVLVDGQFAPVIGSVCMDQCMVDLTDIVMSIISDEVVLYGQQGKNMISIDGISDKLGTIKYEVLCNIAKRVPRIYVHNSNTAKMVDLWTTNKTRK